MSSFERHLSAKLKQIDSSAAPGFALMVAKDGKIVADLRWQKEYTYYDLASLTKILFTTSQWMGIQSQKIASIDRTIKDYLPWYTHSSKVRDLLTHTAGNEWWLPFYKTLAPLRSNYEKKVTLRRLLQNLKPKNTTQSVYSDIDFFLLGELLEEIQESSLEYIWNHFRDTCIPESRLHFNSGNQPLYKKQLYAPTEYCSWRGRILQGEVHDENTWALGGVSSHAGLFGSASDVMQWGLWLRECVRSGNSYVDRATAKRFTTRALPQHRGDWSLGFMMPTQGKASCGQYFDLGSVGHTGFTGTSFWMDIKTDLIVVLLSNRIHPTRKNELFRKVRPLIHDMVVETLME